MCTVAVPSSLRLQVMTATECTIQIWPGGPNESADIGETSKALFNQLLKDNAVLNACQCLLTPYHRQIYDTDIWIIALL